MLIISRMILFFVKRLNSTSVILLPCADSMIRGRCAPRNAELSFPWPHLFHYVNVPYYNQVNYIICLTS